MEPPEMPRRPLDLGGSRDSGSSSDSESSQDSGSSPLRQTPLLPAPLLSSPNPSSSLPDRNCSSEASGESGRSPLEAGTSPSSEPWTLCYPEHELEALRSDLGGARSSPPSTSQARPEPASESLQCVFRLVIGNYLLGRAYRFTHGSGRSCRGSRRPSPNGRAGSGRGPEGSSGGARGRRRPDLAPAPRGGPASRPRLPFSISLRCRLPALCVSTLKAVGRYVQLRHRATFAVLMRQLGQQRRVCPLILVRVTREAFSGGPTNWGRVAAVLAFVRFVLRSMEPPEGVSLLSDHISDTLVQAQEAWLRQQRGWQGLIRFFYGEDLEGLLGNASGNWGFVCPLTYL